jgi:hypothetical protein
MTRDSYLAAFLSLKGFHLQPTKTEQGFIIFQIHGDIHQIESAISEFLAEDTHVGLQEYLRHLKSVRNSIFVLKRLGEDNEETERC